MIVLGTFCLPMIKLIANIHGHKPCGMLGGHVGSYYHRCITVASSAFAWLHMHYCNDKVMQDIIIIYNVMSQVKTIDLMYVCSNAHRCKT